MSYPLELLQKLNVAAASSLPASLAAAALEFDGSAGASFGPGVGAVGAGDWTLLFWLRRDNVLSDIVDVAAGQRFAVEVDSAGPRLWNGAAIVRPTGQTSTLGVMELWALRRSAGVVTASRNGAAFSGGVSESTNFSSPIAFLGRNIDAASLMRGALARVSLLNFALSDVEVADLYANRLGVLPAAWQRGGVRANSGFFSSAEAFTSQTSTGFSLTKTGGWTTFIQSAQLHFPPRGKFYRVSFNATVSGGNWTISNDGYAQSQLVTNGTNTYVVAAYGGGVPWFFSSATNGAAITVANLVYETSGALFIQPDSNSGAGPVLRGNGGLPDLILPGDGHTTGGVYRPAPRLDQCEIEFDVSGNGNRLLGGADVQRIPPGWTIVRAVLARQGASSGNFTLGTSSGGGQIVGSVAIGAADQAQALTLANPQPVSAPGTRLHLSGTLGTGSRLLLTISPVRP